MDPDPLPFLFLHIAAYTPVISDFFIAAFLFILLFVNAVISGSEVAFFSIEKKISDDIHTDTDTKKIRISKLLQNPEKLLASIVIAYTFLNVSITTLVIYLLNRLPYFSGAPMETLVLEVVIAICLILLFVDILPKLYAAHNPLRFATSNARFITLITTIFSPISSILVKTTGIFNRSVIQRRSEISVDDLSKALQITSNEITQEQEKDMLEGIIRFKDKLVDDIFVSRVDMIALDWKTQFTDVISFIVDAGFSRIPVYEESADTIKGVLYVKDLLPHLSKGDNFRWQSLIRPAYFVPGTKRIDDLLEEFRTNKNHMAIVVDEYGGTSGLITMEDILEEIVGDISDEYDEELPLYTMAADGSYIFEGKTSLEDFIKIADVPENDFASIMDEADTIAGLMLELKGDFPKRKELLTYKKYTFQAEEMNKKRILKVRYTPPQKIKAELTK